MSALATIPPADARKLVGCIARLRSDHDGEIIAAARASNRLLDRFGLRLETVVEAAFSASATPGKSPPRATSCDHRAAASWCLERDCWNERELSFLHSAATLACLSEKQRAWLGDLCNRAGWHL